MNQTLLIIIIMVCIFLEGFFSGSEIALVVADKIRIRNRADMGDIKALITRALLKKPRRLFATTLLGTNICVVTATTVLTYFIISNYGEDYSAFALLLSPVILIFGEVLPKSFYQHHADFLAQKVGVLLVWVSYILSPFVWLVSKVTELMLRGVRAPAYEEPRISREELTMLLSSKEAKDSDMPPEERKMIRRVFDLADAEVKNIMIPLAELEMLPASADTEAALSVFDRKGYSKLPLFEHRSHNIVGVVKIADCIFASKPEVLKDIMKPVIYVPENMPVYELYKTLQETKENKAIVVDEFGGATGFVTFEDLLEEVVGEIKDEYELGGERYKILSPGAYIVSGRMEIEEANENLGLAIPYGDYETVAGYILELFGYIPKVGESVTVGEWVYVVKNASPKAVFELEVRKVQGANSSSL